MLSPTNDSLSLPPSFYLSLSSSHSLSHLKYFSIPSVRHADIMLTNRAAGVLPGYTVLWKTTNGQDACVDAEKHIYISYRRQRSPFDPVVTDISISIVTGLLRSLKRHVPKGYESVSFESLSQSANSTVSICFKRVRLHLPTERSHAPSFPSSLSSPPPPPLSSAPIASSPSPSSSLSVDAKNSKSHRRVVSEMSKVSNASNEMSKVSNTLPQTPRERESSSHSSLSLSPSSPSPSPSASLSPTHMTNSDPMISTQGQAHTIEQTHRPLQLLTAEESAEVGVTAELLEYLQEMSQQQEEFSQHPLDRKKMIKFRLSKRQRSHALGVLRMCPRFRSLKEKVVPRDLTEQVLFA